jgi:hypothetical protein
MFFFILSRFLRKWLFWCKKNSLNKVRNFSLKIGQYGHQKIRIFIFTSKMQTYLSDKMHPKKVIAEKTDFLPEKMAKSIKNQFFANNCF